MTQIVRLSWCLTIALIISMQRGWSMGHPTEVKVKSPSGLWEATITPAKNLNPDDFSEYGISANLAAKIAQAKDMASWATATVGLKNGELHTFTLRSPLMPVESVLLDDGTLVTFDQWEEDEYGEVCINYAHNGKVRWSRTLAELFGKRKAFRKSIFAGIMWRIKPLNWSLETDGSALLVRLLDENNLRIRLVDGTASVIEIPNLPDDPTRLLNRANSTENREEAIALLQRAMQINSDDAALDYAIPCRLMTYFESENPYQAIEIGKKALKRLADRGRSNTLLYSEMARIYKKMGLMAEAEQSLRAFVAANPGEEGRSLIFADFLYELGRSNEADDLISDFFVKKGGAKETNIPLLRQIGNFYQTKKPFKALDYYLYAYRSDRVTDVSLYLSLARTYEDLGNLRSALSIYQQLAAYYEATSSAEDDLDRARQQAARLRKRLESQ
jgi:tetratricopeptide (TPR) repeat protein